LILALALNKRCAESLGLSGYSKEVLLADICSFVLCKVQAAMVEAGEAHPFPLRGLPLQSVTIMCDIRRGGRMSS
jgi:hypothetical protein